MASLAGGFLPVAAQPYGIANPDARTLGMGGIETVTSADAYAVFNNPAAGLFGRQKAQVALRLRQAITALCTQPEFPPQEKQNS